MKVLVIDRDHGGRQAYMAIARSSGYVAVSCEDSEMIGVVSAQGIDAVIFGLAAESDIDVLRKLRLAQIALPVILITAASVDRDEARELGVTAIISKPPDLAELREALAKVEPRHDRDHDFAVIFRFLDRCNALDAKAPSRPDIPSTSPARHRNLSGPPHSS